MVSLIDGDFTNWERSISSSLYLMGEKALPEGLSKEQYDNIGKILSFLNSLPKCLGRELAMEELLRSF